eukprot:4626213-Prymnesium_polylepis.2
MNNSRQLTSVSFGFKTDLQPCEVCTPPLRWRQPPPSSCPTAGRRRRPSAGGVGECRSPRRDRTV